MPDALITKAQRTRVLDKAVSTAPNPGCREGSRRILARGQPARRYWSCMSHGDIHRRVGSLLLLATLLVGIAWILVLPPFEGFDETMHYSSLREIADRQTIPVYGKSRVAAVVERYGAKAPLPYLQAHGVAVERPMSYRDFMQDDAAREEFVASFATAPDVPRRFEPGSSLNWQAQHPPLYYLLLAPLMRASDGVSLVMQMTALRVASWIMAVAGLAAGVWGTARHVRRLDCSKCALAEAVPASGTQSASSLSLSALPAACLAYPFLVPMFFPEFARIGNDSLCLLIFGACWALMLSMLRQPTSLWHAAALGACLGAGLLTKAFFVPLSLGMVGCLAWSAWQSIGSGTARRTALGHVGVTAATALLVGGWWYVVAYLQHGAFTGSNDVIALEQNGGLLAGLRAHFDWQHLARSVAGFVATWYFGGTWTLARLPIWMYVPGLAAIAMMCAVAVRWLRVPGARPLTTAALWVIAPLLGAFACYMLVRIAGGSQGHGTPGWYMNILAPACAVPLGAGLIAVARWPRVPWLAMAMWAWMVSFVLASFWMHAALYAGVAVKDMETRQLSCPDGWSSLLDVAEIHSRLSVFGWPTASLICVGGGALLALLAASLHRRSARRT